MSSNNHDDIVGGSSRNSSNVADPMGGADMAIESNAAAAAASATASESSDLVEALRRELLARDESIFDLQLSLQAVEAEKSRTMQEMERQSQQQIRHLQEQLRRATHEANLARSQALKKAATTTSTTSSLAAVGSTTLSQPHPSSSFPPIHPPNLPVAAAVHQAVSSSAPVPGGTLPTAKALAPSSTPAVTPGLPGFNTVSMPTSLDSAAGLLMDATMTFPSDADVDAAIEKKDVATGSATATQVAEAIHNYSGGASSFICSDTAGGATLVRIILDLITKDNNTPQSHQTSTLNPSVQATAMSPSTYLVPILLGLIHRATTESDVVWYLMERLLSSVQNPPPTEPKNELIEQPIERSESQLPPPHDKDVPSKPPSDTTRQNPKHESPLSSVSAPSPQPQQQQPHYTDAWWNALAYALACCSSQTREQVIQATTQLQKTEAGAQVDSRNPNDWTLHSSMHWGRRPNRRSCIVKVTRKSNTSNEEAEGNTETNAMLLASVLQTHPMNAVPPQVSMVECQVAVDCIQFACDNIVQWNTSSLTCSLRSCQVLWLLLEESPFWRPSPKLTTDAKDNNTPPWLDWLWNQLLPTWEGAVQKLLQHRNPKARRRLAAAPQPPSTATTATTTTDAAATTTAGPKKASDRDTQGSDTRSWELLDLLQWLTTTIRFFTLDGPSKYPSRLATEGTKLMVDPMSYRRLLANVLDLMELEVLMSIFPPSSRDSDRSKWNNDPVRKAHLLLAVQCVNFLDHLARVDPPCPTAIVASSSGHTFSKATAKPTPMSRLLVLLRVQMPTSRSTPTTWDRAPSAIAVAVGLLHVVACNLEERDVYQVYTEPCFGDRFVAHALVRFFYELLRQVQLERRLPESIEDDDTTKNKKETNNSQLSFLSLLTECLHIFATAASLLLHSSSHHYDSNVNQQEEEEIRTMLRIQMEELAADEDEELEQAMDSKGR